MLLQMSVEVVLILSGRMHLAPGGKNDIVTVNLAICERLFLQGLIFHVQERTYNCSSSYISNNNIPTKGVKREMRNSCSLLRRGKLDTYLRTCLSTIRNDVRKPNLHPGIRAYPIFVTWKKLDGFRELFLTVLHLT